MNIGIVCYPTIGGSGVIATELAKALSEKGHNVHLISYEKPFRLENYKSENICFHKINILDYPLFRYPPFEFNLAGQIADIIKKEKLEILHIHYAIPFVMSAYVAKQSLQNIHNVKIIVTLHGTDITLINEDRESRKLLSFLLKEMDGVTAVSNYLSQHTESLCDITDIKTIHNFVDTSWYTPTKFKKENREIYANDKEKIIIHVSNMREVKRPIDVLEAFIKIKKEIPAKLILIGNGPMDNSINQFIIQHKIEDKVHKLSNHNHIADILAISDLFILPSAQESFGLAALEAMSSGVPVVVSNAGGLPELVIDGQTGYISQIADIDSIVINSLKILKDEQKHKYMSENAYHLAQENFSKDMIIKEYEEFYKFIKESIHS